MKRILALTMLLTTFPSAARADIVHYYYVGVDSQPAITSGAYSGLANPNLNHLTFLFGHQTTPPDGTESGSHFHAKGSFSYTGANLGAGTAVNPYNGVFGVNNTSRDDNLWQLQPGTGSLSGMFVAGQDSTDKSGNYSRLQGVQTLSGGAAGSADFFLYHSGGDRWNQSLNAAHLRLNLLSITAGFSVVDAGGGKILDQAGQTLDLGAGGSLNFTPIFATSTPGLTGSAVFTLSDINGVFGNSGQFVYNLSAVPEPSSMLLLSSLAVGMTGSAGWRRFTSRRRARYDASR